MEIVFFSSKSYDRESFEQANATFGFGLRFLEEPLTERSAAGTEEGAVVCPFVNDRLSRATLQALASRSVRLIALRCAGFNNVDLAAAAEFGITVARVPAYSPHAVAEHAVALLLSVNRKIHKAYARVREGNYSLDGLCGFDLHGRTVGVVGTGKIGAVFARILLGFGCTLLGHDPQPDPSLEALGLRYVALDELFASADVISLHCPLVPATKHLINARSLSLMRPGATLINTGRGALVDAQALISALKSRRLGAVGLDVYEEEAPVFFEDHSTDIIQDDTLVRLLSFPNVLLTSHQGFLTEEALQGIAEVTLGNVAAFTTGAGQLHRVEPA